MNKVLGIEYLFFYKRLLVYWLDENLEPDIHQLSRVVVPLVVVFQDLTVKHLHVLIPREHIEDFPPVHEYKGRDNTSTGPGIRLFNRGEQPVFFRAPQCLSRDSNRSTFVFRILAYFRAHRFPCRRMWPARTS